MPFSVVLFFLTVFIFLVAFALFGIDLYLYAFKRSFIDYQLHLLSPEDAWCLVLLFGIPPILQLVGLLAMFQRLRRDKSLTYHYAICVFIMSLCPLSYCLLWLLYMLNLHTWQVLSYAALSAIAVLLAPVVLMTYAIMWTPRRNPLGEATQLGAGDIKQLDALCDGLKQDGINLKVYPRRILDRLPISIRNQIMYAKDKTDYEQISKADLAAALNGVLKQRDLHLAINLDSNDISDEARALLLLGQKSLTDGEVQRLHLLLLTACFSGAIETPPPPPDRGKSDRLIRWWEHLLLNIKEGVAKVHFWVLANFFAVFLGITYLFCFAFAFHDQKTIRDEDRPALYMANTLYSESGGLQVEDSVAAAHQKKGVASYNLYFDSFSGHPDLSDKKFTPAGNELEDSKDWKGMVNYRQLGRIAEDIKNLTGDGRGVKIEVTGQTDCNALQNYTTYPSNYELSEARAQNIKYLLEKKLWETEKGRRNIEWVILPVSTEGIPMFPRPGGKPEEVQCSEDAAAKGKRKTITTSRQGGLSSNGNSNLITALENKKNTIGKGEGFNSEQDGALRGEIDKLKEIAVKHKLDGEQAKGCVIKIDSLARAMGDLSDATREAEKPGLFKEEKEALDRVVAEKKEVVDRKKDEVQESIDVFKYVDEAGRRRVVVVSIIPVLNYNEFTPLSLMDYMYFTIYTITTTGYGDIVPKTTFSKFLCSFANILEVFFLVVFFNALLSVKGENRLARARDRR